MSPAPVKSSVLQRFEHGKWSKYANYGRWFLPGTATYAFDVITLIYKYSSFFFLGLPPGSKLLSVNHEISLVWPYFMPKVE